MLVDDPLISSVTDPSFPSAFSPSPLSPASVASPFTTSLVFRFDIVLANEKPSFGGWSFALPPGIYPPGPPPIPKIDPVVPIEVDIKGSIPWPGFIIDPDGNPTFSSKPESCKTETAEMCLTTTSYGVLVDGTTTSTTAERTISTCGTIYGCDVADDSISNAISSTTTVSTETPTVTGILLKWEKWDIDEYTENQLNEIADKAQARLDKKFGKISSPTLQATTNKLAGASPPTLTSEPIGVPSSPGFSCVSTATYTECGDSGNPKTCVQAPTCASWVNTAAITMTTSDMRPSCNAGYETYSATAHAAIPTQGGPLKFLIPLADDRGSDWNFVIAGNDARKAVKSWKVGNDKIPKLRVEKEERTSRSGGTYVELQLQASEIAEKNVTFTANGGITPCMPDCRGNTTTTTDIDGMICTHYPCHSAICEQGPAPEPQATCELDRKDLLFWPLYFDVSILANGHSWMNDGGKKLKEEVKGCGAITKWHSKAIEVATEKNWTARHSFDFTSPVFLKGGCVERAIASAGGPSGIKCKKAHHMI